MSIRLKGHFVFDSSGGPKRFRRSTSEAFFDPCRRILVRATPEEQVRQQFCVYLTKVLRFPWKLVRTEVNLIHLNESAARRGRVDIVVSRPDGCPVLLVECKAETVSITDDTLDQVLRYRQVIKVPSILVATTNGHDTRWYRVSRGGKTHRLASAPDFYDLLEGKVPADSDPDVLPRRSVGLGLSGEAFRWMMREGILGEGSPRTNYGYLTNIAGLLLLERAPPTLRGRAGRFRVIESGMRYTSFGNAAGGNWDGLYRYFIIEDRKGHAQIISFSVMGKLFERDHPVFGNTNGCTTLLVAVDDYEKRHNSLQLDLDRFVERAGESLNIWHNGTLTRGKRGAAPRADVVEFTRKHAPHLVVNDRVRLGNLPVHRAATWQDAKVLLSNLIDYALVRDEYRKFSG